MIRTCQEPGARCPTMEISGEVGVEQEIRLQEQERSPCANVVVVVTELLVGDRALSWRDSVREVVVVMMVVWWKLTAVV